jgi:hypothetical protein
LIPLGRKCNEAFDLVPAYVNPAIIALLGAAVAFVALAFRASHRSRKPTDGSTP